MKTARYTFCLLLAATIVLTGCAASKLVTESWTAPKPVPDPLEGWTRLYFVDQLDKAIVADCQDYMQKLPPEERTYVGPRYFEDKTGQHAARFTIGLKGTVWEHVLIYDKDNKRIKTIKYANGTYRS